MKILYSIEGFNVRIEKMHWKKNLYKYGVQYPKTSEMRFFTTMENAKNHIISQKRLEIERLSKLIEDLKEAIEKIESIEIIEEQVIALEKIFKD